MGRLTFHKTERLTQKKIISRLFERQGSVVHRKNLIIAFLPLDEVRPSRAQVLLSVSKRKFKRAHHRNLLKRRMKEAYRLNKSTLLASLEEKNKYIAIAFIYNQTKQLAFTEIEDAVKAGLDEIDKRYS